MRPEARAAMEAPLHQEILLSSNQAQQRYWGALLAFVLGVVLVLWFLFGKKVPSWGDYIIAGGGLVAFFVAWRLFWDTRGGYPRLSILGSRLTHHRGSGRATAIDLGALGPAELVVTKPRPLRFPLPPIVIGSPTHIVAFRDRATYEALEATGMLEPITVDGGARAVIALAGFIGHDQALAQEIADVINARRDLVKAPLAMSDEDIDRRVAQAVRRRRLNQIGLVVVLVVVGIAAVVLKMLQ